MTIRASQRVRSVYVPRHCTYPQCRCVVQTSTSSPTPACPRGLAPAQAQSHQRIVATFRESSVPHLRVTPTRTALMRKQIETELERGRAMRSASGWSASIAVNICEERGWSYRMERCMDDDGVAGYVVQRVKGE